MRQPTVMSEDKVWGFSYSSRIDGGDYFLVTDSRHFSAEWVVLHHAWQWDNIQKGIWQRKSDNRVEFLDAVHQYACDLVKRPSAFRSFSLTSFKIGFSQDSQCPHSVF